MTRLQRVLLIIVALFLGGFLFVVVSEPYPFWEQYHEKTELPTDLVAAEARWAGHPIGHYSLTIVRQAERVVPTQPTCEQDLEVRNEQIVAVSKDTCSNSSYLVIAISPTTVSGLFKVLEHDTTEIRWAEDVNCGQLSVVEAAYDPQSGYPTTITYSWVLASPASMGRNTYSQYRGSRMDYHCIGNYLPNKGSITTKLTLMS